MDEDDYEDGYVTELQQSDGGSSAVVAFARHFNGGVEFQLSLKDFIGMTEDEIHSVVKDLKDIRDEFVASGIEVTYNVDHHSIDLILKDEA